MSDIVERLRVHGDQFPIKNSAEWVDFASLYLVEAADEIERLRAALREIESNWEVPMEEKGWRALARFMWETARAALEDRT